LLKAYDEDLLESVSTLDSVAATITQHMNNQMQDHLKAMFPVSTGISPLESDPFLKCAYGTVPDCIPLNDTLEPLAFLSQIHETNAHIKVMANSLKIPYRSDHHIVNTASIVQSGNILQDNSYVANNEKLLKECKHNLATASQVLGIDGVRKYRLQGVTSMPADHSRRGSSIQTSSRPATSSRPTAGEASQPEDDLALESKVNSDVVNQFSSLLTMLPKASSSQDRGHQNKQSNSHQPWSSQASGLSRKSSFMMKRKQSSRDLHRPASRGQLQEPSSPLPHQLSTSTSLVKSTISQLEDRYDLPTIPVRPSSSLSGSTLMIPSSPLPKEVTQTSIDEGSFSESQLNANAEDNFTGEVYVPPASSYETSKHDKFSIHSDLMPLSDHFGQDEASLYIVWALAHFDGFGYGMFGCSSTMDLITLKIDANKQQGTSMRVREGNYSISMTSNMSSSESDIKAESISIYTSAEKLVEVRERLIAFDAMLASKCTSPISTGIISPSSKPQAPLSPMKSPGPIRTSSSMSLKQVKDESLRHVEKSRFILSLLLVKLSYMINSRRDIFLYIKQSESILKSLISADQGQSNRYGFNRPQANEALYADDVYYIAISKRFRLQYEEWMSISSRSEKKFVHYAGIVLPAAKEYVKYAMMGKDVTMKRDALKHLMNVYIEISQLPGLYRNDISYYQQRSMDSLSPIKSPTKASKSIFSPGSSEGSSVNPDSAAIEDPLLRSYLTIEELEKRYSPDDIDLKEVESLNWVRHASKARALQVLRRMKTL
jgi:hypothetical protein